MQNRKPKPSDDYSKFDAETGVQTHDQAGREIPDPEPMQPPLGWQPADPIAVRIREMIIGHKLADEARQAGAETFEEADDFDVGDDFEAEKFSPYEANFDPMTPEERAALSTQGRDTERTLTAEEKVRLSPKQKKQKTEADQADDDIADPEGKASKRPPAA